MKRIIAILLLATTACTHTDLERNAPGIIDVTKRPQTDLDREPRDPGEQMVILAYGGFAGAGFASGGPPTRGYVAAGPEVGITYGVNERSHHEDDFFFYPGESYGLNIGLTALTGEGQGIGPLFGEASFHSEAVSLSPGWAWDINDKTHGPQVTLAIGPLYFRMTHQLETSTNLSIGLLLQGEHALIWSR